MSSNSCIFLFVVVKFNCNDAKERIMTKEEMFKFIKKQNVALLSSVDGDGFPNIKAINAPRKIDGNDMYFSTNTSSMRVSQFKIIQKPAFIFIVAVRFLISVLCLSELYRY